MIERGSSSEKKKSSIFGKGTFGRKLLLTMVLLGAGLAVGFAGGRELASFSKV